jgi:hypothetical protein
MWKETMEKIPYKRGENGKILDRHADNIIVIKVDLDNPRSHLYGQSAV